VKVADGLKKLPAAFYRARGGAEPVRRWLKALSAADRGTIGRDIATVEFGWPIGMPLCRPMGDGMWEIRSALEDGRTARVLFSVAGQRIVLLHAFVKKSRKTPRADLSLARSRKKEVDR